MMPSPADIALIAVLGAAAALVATGVGLIVLRLGRRWSLAAQLRVVVGALVLSMVGGTVAVARAMFLSSHDLVVTIWVAGVSGLVSLGVASLLGRSFMRTVDRLLVSARAVGEGATVGAQAYRTTELNALAAELASTSERLAQARREVERMEASRRELVAWVSHDLRTPLASMRAMAEALEDGLVDDPARYHRGIRLQVDHLAVLVEDLFELSKLHTGQPRVARSPASVYDLVSDVIADLAPFAQQQQVSIAAEGDLDATIDVDATLLIRALENLVSNALRFSPAGAAVTIGVRRTPAATEISVSDHGGGLDDAAVDRIFEAGWRGDPARSAGADTGAPAAGAGLGLAIVKSIAEVHGGSVSAENVPGGSRFTLVLPTQDLT